MPARSRPPRATIPTPGRPTGAPRLWNSVSLVFERLSQVLHASPTHGPSDLGTPPDGTRQAVGAVAGTSLADGLYRLHTADSAASADQWVRAAYPDFAGRIACFGVDWLGRQFSLDPSRGTAMDPEVLMFDVGAGEALEIPVAFSRFHDSELVDYTEAALASDFFAEWIEAHPESIGFEQCVGYRVPLFLGGRDELENLELIDVDVYWTLTGQLRVAALE